MASLFSARRKPKRIAREEPDDQVDNGEEDTGPVVRRPHLSAPRTKSKLRVSFNPGEEDGSGSGTGASTPAEGGAPVQQTKKPSSRLGLAQELLSRRDQDNNDETHSRYSKASLDELRNSTPSTPRDLQVGTPAASLELITPSTKLELDLEAKFGKAALMSQSSRIPSAAEIQEKKDRRARLALEQAANTSSGRTGQAGDDFISLEDYDSDGEFRPHRMQVGTYVSQPKEKDTRLLHEDEDIAEGFDAYVEDAGRVTLSKKGLKEQSRKEREDIRAMINAAEGGSASDSNTSNDEGESDSNSDLDRRREYELAQTHRGMDGLRNHKTHTARMTRPTQPRETTPIPSLNASLSRLRDVVSALSLERSRILKRQADIVREKTEIQASQEHIQRSLEEAGQELERVKREVEERNRREIDGRGANGTGGGALQSNGHGRNQLPLSSDVNSNPGASERGLESFGERS